MRATFRPRPDLRRLASPLAALALAACGSASGPLEMPANDKQRDRTPGVEAVLTPLNGSAAQGTIKIVDRGGSLTVVGAINNLLPGPYRIAIHERGNCSSPNGFSAGKPWAPPGFPRPAGEMLPEIAIGGNGNGVVSATLRGVKLAAPDGVEGRSVVVHAGSRVDDNVVPGGVPNALVLCGVLGPIRSFMDLFRDRRSPGARMAMLADPKVLVTGILSNRSIAYGVARACRREGAALAFTYVNDELKDRVAKIAAEFGACPLLRCDVARDEDIDALFDSLGREWGGLDGMLHSIAFAPREALAGDFLASLTRQAFGVAHDISSYSLAALAKGARPLMQGRPGSIVTLSYLGAVRSVPNYNVMGLAKASLEANVRYLASCLGPEGIRVNGISAGPIKTLAASGIGGFGKLLSRFEATAPLRRGVTIDEVGNVAAFLLSSLSSAVTGEITYVDGGYSTVAVAGDAEA